MTGELKVAGDLRPADSSATGAVGIPLDSRRRTITLYAAAVFMYWIGLYLYVPTLPVYVQGKSESLAMVGVILSMYGLWQGIVRLPLGITADWLGRRKPFIMVGFALLALGVWTMGVAGTSTGLLVGRAITGLAAATWVPLVVTFSALFPPEDAVKASALLTFVGSAGRLLATGANGFLNQWGGYSLAFFLAAGAALLAILFLLAAREVKRPPHRPSYGAVARLIFRRDVLLPSLLSAVAQYVNWTVTFGFLPILAEGFGAGDVTQSMLVSSSIAISLVGNLTATALVERLGTRTMVVISFTLLAAGMGLAAVAASLAWLFAGQLCIGLAMGAGYPVLMGMSIRHVADEERTTAMGLHQAVYAGGMFAGPGVSGLLADAMGIQPMFVVTAVASLLVGVTGTLWLRTEAAANDTA